MTVILIEFESKRIGVIRGKEDQEKYDFLENKINYLIFTHAHAI